MSDTLREGATAPHFDLPRDGGGNVCITDLRGKAVVLYFYPKDDTSGCTREALDFTAQAKEFADLGAVVIGVSKDTVAKHDKFRDKYDLGVILASDAEGDTCETYGTWVEKSMYGRTYWGIERATFLIAPDGTIARIWPKVKVDGHVAAVLDAIKAL